MRSSASWVRRSCLFLRSSDDVHGSVWPLPASAHLDWSSKARILDDDDDILLCHWVSQWLRRGKQAGVY